MAYANDLYVLWDYVVSLAPELKPNSIAYKSVRSFTDIIGHKNRDGYSLTDALTKWTQVMTARGVSPSTRLSYLTKLHSFYKSAVKLGLLEYQSIFDPFLDEAREQKDNPVEQGTLASEICLRLVADRSLTETDRKLRDLLMLSVYDCGANPMDAVFFKKTDLPSLPQISAIIKANSLNPQQQYAIALDQNRDRANTVTKNIRTALTRLLATYGYKGSVKDFAAEAWLEAATTLGYTDSAIKTAIKEVPARCSYIEKAQPEDVLASDLAKMSADVANYFEDYTERWYLVRLNRVVASVTERRKKSGAGRDRAAELIGDALRKDSLATETFFPYQELTRRVGKKLKTVSKPYISGFMFIRTSAPKLPAIAAEIIDWGRLTRRSRRSDAPYAIVADREMERFKTAVGLMTAASNIRVENMPAVRPGDKVVVRGSGYEDRMFEVGDVQAAKGGASAKLTLLCPNGLKLVIDNTPDIEIIDHD